MIVWYNFRRKMSSKVVGTKPVKRCEINVKKTEGEGLLNELYKSS